MDTTSESKETETLGTRTEIEEVDACKRRIKAAIPVEKVREELDKSYRELMKSVQLPGFRRGRVPRQLLEARFGEEIHKDIKDTLVQTSFAEVVAEKELKIIGEPNFENIEFAKDADLTYEVELEIQPEFTLGQYKGIEVEPEPGSVTDKEVEEQIESLRKNHARLVAIDPAEGGPDDFYHGKYHLVRDGTRVKSSGEVIFMPARGTLESFVVPDLEQRVKDWDASSTEPLWLDVKVPGTYPDEVLRGVELQLEFHLDEVRRPEMDPLDDEFAKKLGQETMDALRGEVRASLEARQERKRDTEIENTILAKIADNTDIELPAGLLDRQRGRWRMSRERELLVEEGLPPDQVKETLEKEGEAAQEDLRRELKTAFILERIGDKEKIFVTEDEVAEHLHLLAMYHQVPLAQLREEMRSSGRIEDIRQNLRHEKVRTFLRKKARVVGEENETEAKPEEKTADVAASPAQEEPAAEADKNVQTDDAPGVESTDAGGSAGDKGD